MLLLPLLRLTLLAAPLKIAAAGLGGVGVDDSLLAALSEQAALEVAQASNVSVITRSDVAALIGAERQRQLLGCADESSTCIAELAGALGADLLLSGDVSKVGARYTATLKLLEARTGRAVYSGVGDAANEDELLAVVKRLARAARASLGGAASARWQPAVPLALGVASASVGAFLLVKADGNVSRIHSLSGTSSAAVLAEGARLRDEGKLLASVGTALAVLGGALLVAALVWWLWP